MDAMTRQRSSASVQVCEAKQEEAGVVLRLGRKGTCVFSSASCVGRTDVAGEDGGSGRSGECVEAKRR